MNYPRLGFTGEEKRSFLGILTAACHVVEPETSVSQARDPDDDKFLETAVAAGAGYVVSGDDDLPDIGSFRDSEIVTAAELLNIC